MRLHSAVGHNQAAELLSFESGGHILEPTLFRGAGCAEKGCVEVSSDIFCMVNQKKKQQNEVIFPGVLARLVTAFLLCVVIFYLSILHFIS